MLLGKYQFYFPKNDFEKYGDFDRMDYKGYDIDTKIKLHADLSPIFNSIVEHLKGRVVKLYCKSEGMSEYATIKLNTTVAVHRVLTADIVYNYAGWIYEIFKEFNGLCDKRKNVGLYGKLVDLFRGRPTYNNGTVSKHLFFNISVYGILGEGVKHDVQVMSRGFLFNYLFAKYILDFGESKFSWITDDDIDAVYEVFVVDLEPYFEKRLELMKKAVELMNRGRLKRPEYIVLSYLRRNEVIDVDLPLDLLTEMVNNGWLNPAYYIRRACYDLWKKGIVEGEEGEYTFLDSEGKIKMPRRFRLKRK